MEISQEHLITQAQFQGQQQVQTNNLIVKMLKSKPNRRSSTCMEFDDEKYIQYWAFQLSQEDFRLNILYTDPSPINYLSPVDKSIWPEDLDDEILLNTLKLDRLNAYQDLVSMETVFLIFYLELQLTHVTEE